MKTALFFNGRIENYGNTFALNGINIRLPVSCREMTEVPGCRLVALYKKA